MTVLRRHDWLWPHSQLKVSSCDTPQQDPSHRTVLSRAPQLAEMLVAGTAESYVSSPAIRAAASGRPGADRVRSGSAARPDDRCRMPCPRITRYNLTQNNASLLHGQLSRSDRLQLVVLPCMCGTIHKLPSSERVTVMQSAGTIRLTDCFLTAAGSVNSHSTTLHHPVSQSRHRTLLDNTGGALVAGDSADESTSGNSSNPANSAGIVAGMQNSERSFVLPVHTAAAGFTATNLALMRQQLPYCLQAYLRHTAFHCMPPQTLIFTMVGQGQRLRRSKQKCTPRH